MNGCYHQLLERLHGRGRQGDSVRTRVRNPGPSRLQLYGQQHSMILPASTVFATTAVSTRWMSEQPKAVAMEANAPAVGRWEGRLQLVEETGKGTDRGAMIGKRLPGYGPEARCQAHPHGKGAVTCCIRSAGPESTGVTYATSHRWARHTCVQCTPEPCKPDYNPTASTGQAPVSGFLQWYFAAIDSLGMCLFASLPLLDMPDLQKHLVDCATAESQVRRLMKTA